MPDTLLDTSSGIPSNILESITANVGDVLKGKVFLGNDGELHTGTMEWAGGTVTQIANVNTRATSYSVSGSGHAYYVFVSTTGHGKSSTTGFSVTGGTKVLYSYMTTTDFDDGLGRYFGHFCIIKANNPSGTVTVNATVGDNYYGAARCIFVGL